MNRSTEEHLPEAGELDILCIPAEDDGIDHDELGLGAVFGGQREVVVQGGVIPQFQGLGGQKGGGIPLVAVFRVGNLSRDVAEVVMVAGDHVEALVVQLMILVGSLKEADEAIVQ